MSSMIFGWHPVSNSTSPLACSIRMGGQTKVNGCGRSGPIGGIVNWAPDRPHIRRHFAILMSLSSVYPFSISGRAAASFRTGKSHSGPGPAHSLALLLRLRKLCFGLFEQFGVRGIPSEMLDLQTVGADQVLLAEIGDFRLDAPLHRLFDHRREPFGLEPGLLLVALLELGNHALADQFEAFADLFVSDLAFLRD